MQYRVGVSSVSRVSELCNHSLDRVDTPGLHLVKLRNYISGKYLVGRENERGCTVVYHQCLSASPPAATVRVRRSCRSCDE
jgi:hypothetical protein